MIFQTLDGAGADESEPPKFGCSTGDSKKIKFGAGVVEK